MVRVKKEYKCTICEIKAPKFFGYCSSCGAAGTCEEIPQEIVAKPRESTAARKRRRQWKDSERGISRRMQDVDGKDPLFSKIATSTGRVGAITHLQFDAVSKNYVTENKNRVLPAWLNKAWIQIVQRGIDLNKNALLHLDPPNIPKSFAINGTKQKTPTMAVITQDRHESLIRAERALNFVLSQLDVDSNLLYEIHNIMNKNAE